MISIADLFDKDTAELTPDERKEIVKQMRERRNIWVTEEQRVRAAGKGRAKLDQGTARKIQLDDLNLDSLLEDL